MSCQYWFQYPFAIELYIVTTILVIIRYAKNCANFQNLKKKKCSDVFNLCVQLLLLFIDRDSTKSLSSIFYFIFWILFPVVCNNIRFVVLSHFFQRFFSFLFLLLYALCCTEFAVVSHPYWVEEKYVKKRKANATSSMYTMIYDDVK